MPRFELVEERVDGVSRVNRAHNDFLHGASDIDPPARHSSNDPVETIHRVANPALEPRPVTAVRIQHAIRQRLEDQCVETRLCQGSAFFVARLPNSIQFLQVFQRQTATSVPPDLPPLPSRQRPAQGFHRRDGEAIFVPKCHVSQSLRDTPSIFQTASLRASDPRVAYRGGRALHWVWPADCYSEIDSRTGRIGSAPVGCRGAVAQLVEQRPFKPWVPGSSPGRLTTPMPVAHTAREFLPKK